MVTDCAFTGYGITGTAPPVNGRPAWWVNYDSLAWEYAPGAWAQLSTRIQPVTGALHVPAKDVDGWIALQGKNGSITPPSAAALALLEKVASHVKYGQAQPIAFPFQYSSPLPSGWQLRSTTFTILGNMLLGASINAGPAADPSALSVGGSISQLSTGASWSGKFGCGRAYGQAATVTRYGVSWTDRVINEPGKHVEMLCSTGVLSSTEKGLVNGLMIGIDVDKSIPGSNAPLPGSASLGGAFGVFARLRVFSATHPSAWTTAPLG